MNKKPKPSPANDKGSIPVYKDDKILTEEEIMSRPGTRDVLRVFNGWKMDESETHESLPAVPE